MMREGDFSLLLLEDAAPVFQARQQALGCQMPGRTLMPDHSDVLNDSSGDKVEESGQRNQHLENYFAYVADAIMVTEINGRVIDANSATCRLLGYSKDELLTLHLWDFVTNTSRSEILDLLCHLQHGVPATVQRTCCNRDGEHLVIDLRLTRFESAGRDLVIVVCHDVTETRRLEEQLRKSEHNLAEGQRLTQTGSWVLDPKTGETDWSIGICRIFGFPDPPPSPHYSEFRARVHADDRDAVDQL
jgi:PAS domain S-box-containing protein